MNTGTRTETKNQTEDMTEIESFKKTIEELARNFKAGSFDLNRLSEWVKLTSDDLLKTINQREKAIKERDEARSEVENLKNCLDGATKDRECWIERAKQKDETISVIRAEMERLRGELCEVSKERDEAIVDVKRLNEELADWEILSDRLKDAVNSAKQKTKARNDALDELRKERDIARAEVEIWKGVVGKQSMKISAMEKRPEPSRLEIAATLLAASMNKTKGCDWVIEEEVICALEDADKLIAAAKEEVGK